MHFSRLVIQKSPWFADNKGGSYANRYIDTSAICMRIFRLHLSRISPWAEIFEGTQASYR